MWITQQGQLWISKWLLQFGILLGEMSKQNIRHLKGNLFKSNVSFWQKYGHIPQTFHLTKEVVKMACFWVVKFSTNVPLISYLGRIFSEKEFTRKIWARNVYILCSLCKYGLFLDYNKEKKIFPKKKFKVRLCIWILN